MTGFWRLFSQIKHYKRNVILSIIANILTAVFTVISIPLVIPFFQILFNLEPANLSQPGLDAGLDERIKYEFSSIIANNDRQTALLIMCIIIVAAFFLKNLFRYLALFFMAPVRNGIVRDLRDKLFSKFLYLPLSFYSEEKKGDLMARMTADVQEIEWSILNVIEVIFKAPLIIIGSVCIMLYMSLKLTLFVFVLMLFTIFIIGTISKALKKNSMKAQKRLANINSITDETISGLRIVKGFNAQEYQKEKFSIENEAYKNVLTRLLWRRDVSSPLSEFLGISVVAVLLWYGSNLVFQNQLGPETFFAFVFAFYQVIEPTKSFSNAFYNIQKGLAALSRVDEIIDTPDGIIQSQKQQEEARFNQSIHFENISFQYDDNTPVLRNINLEILKGDFVALVGASGGGKSTLVDLLPRFIGAYEGTIKLDGTNIESFKLSSLRSLFGIVSQDSVLFNDTVYNNILFGRKSHTEEDIIKAAKIANAHDFISELPNGYQTNIGDRGVKLSGGQRQRLNISRAVLSNPPILILDEATSALDTESEKQVQMALENVMKSRTAIVIAHRLSTIQKANKIIVMNDGEIVEQGTHQTLLQKGAYYSKLVKMQNV